MNRKSKIENQKSLLYLLAVLLVGNPTWGDTKPQSTTSPPAPATITCALAGGMTDEQFIALTATLAASEQPITLLLDTAANKQFLTKLKPGRVIPIGSFPKSMPDLEKRLGMKVEPAVEWQRGVLPSLWKSVFPHAEKVVLFEAGSADAGQSRAMLLQAACLAGSLRAPFFVTKGDPKDMEELRSWLTTWKTREILAIGKADRLCQDMKHIQLTRLSDAKAVSAAYLKNLLATGPVGTLIVANPADDQAGMGKMSSLAPWVALERRGVLLLTNKAGDNTAELVQNAMQNADLRGVNSLIFVASPKSIAMPQRPNPVAGKDKFIEMEPLTPTGSEPFSFATGRLFHSDRSIVALMLARQASGERRAEHVERRAGVSPLIGTPSRPLRKALVVSNPGGGLPLLELFSRNTAREFRNAGYETTTLFHNEVNKDQVRRLLPEQDIFLWEGHHKTLVKDYGLPKWTEPLPPSLIFLQSCLALNEEEALPLLTRGSIAVVGSSTRTYSASGGAMSLAFFNALLYEDQTLGGSLRQAKNFLLCYSLLKEKRLGDKAKLTGANQRTAWAFTLWGDPTLKLPRPARPADALPHVQHRVEGKHIILSLPDKPYDRYVTDSYQSELWPNARMAGLLASVGDEDGRRFVPFLFAEVALPDVPDGKTPTLRGKLPSSHWVFCWDSRRKVGYVLARPRAKDRGELRFQMHFEE